MNESILNSIKKMLMLPSDYDAFDQDLIIHINTFLTRLYQVGVGAKNFFITGPEQTWSDFLGEDEEAKYQQAKSYVYMRVRLIFDPPTSGAASEAFKETLRELEWLLFVDADPALTDSGVDWSS